MVKFGWHMAATRNQTKSYLVDYELLREYIETGDCDAFIAAWRDGLQQADAEHESAVRTIWKTVWSAIAQRRRCR